MVWKRCCASGGGSEKCTAVAGEREVVIPEGGVMVGSLCSFGGDSGLMNRGSFCSDFSFLGMPSSSSSAWMVFAEASSILRFLDAAALAIAAFDFSRGAAGVGGFSEGPPLGCMPFAFMSLSYRFALKWRSGWCSIADVLDSRCSFAHYTTFFCDLHEVDLKQSASN